MAKDCTFASDASAKGRRHQMIQLRRHFDNLYLIKELASATEARFAVVSRDGLAADTLSLQQAWDNDLGYFIFFDDATAFLQAGNQLREKMTMLGATIGWFESPESTVCYSVRWKDTPSSATWYYGEINLDCRNYRLRFPTKTMVFIDEEGLSYALSIHQ